MKRNFCLHKKNELLNVKRLLLKNILSLLVLLFTSSQLFAQGGEALDFDGVDDYVALPLAVGGSYTKEAWINPSNITGNHNLITGSTTALFFEDGVLKAGHASGGFVDVVDASGALPINTWTHVAVTYDAASGLLSLYKNGTLVASATNANAYTETNMALGNFPNYSVFFQGKMDEVRLWNVARTSTEIANTMSCDLTDDEPGLIAYYKFNQGDAGNDNAAVTTLLDSHDACTPQNGTLMNFGLTPGTISNWVAPGAYSQNFCNPKPNIKIVGNGGLCILDGDVTPSIADGSDFGDLGADPKSQVFTILNTGTSNLTISGVTSSDPTDFTVTTLPASTITPGNSSTFTVVFNPSVTLGIKTATITINNDDADEGVYTFSVQGDVVGGGESLSFDGINSWVNLPVSLSGSYTKEVWIKPDVSSLVGFPNIITGTGTALYLYNGVPTAGHATTYNEVNGLSMVNPGVWTHLAVTYDDPSNTMILYVDGVMQSSGVTSPYAEPSLNLGIYSGGNFFAGEMDEVRIWNTVRSATDIANDMNCKLNGDEPGLIAYYDFNQGIAGVNNPSEVTLYDKTDNCAPKNGTLNGFAFNKFVAPGATTGFCGGAEPNIRIRGGSSNICISSGDITPDTQDGTDFGFYSDPGIDHVFVIENNGSDVLDISGINISGTDASWFTVLVSPVLTTLLPGQSTQFTIRFAGVGLGVRTATISILNTDPDEGNFSFAVQGEGTILVPVSLLNFNGNNNERVINLFWNTSNEINNSGFDILRTDDTHTNWTKLGFVEPSGLSTGHYQFTDVAPMQGINAYRLRQVDANGNFKYSNILVFNFDVKSSTVRLYPNPATTRLQMLFNDADLLNTYAEMYTITGTRVGKVLLSRFNQEIDLSNFPSGVYFIKLVNGKALKVVKQ